MELDNLHKNLLKMRQLQLQVLANSFATTDELKYRVTLTIKEEIKKEQPESEKFY